MVEILLVQRGDRRRGRFAMTAGPGAGHEDLLADRCVAQRAAAAKNPYRVGVGVSVGEARPAQQAVEHFARAETAGKRQRLNAEHVLFGENQLDARRPRHGVERSEEHTSELQSLMRRSYAVFCLKKIKIQLLTI